MTHRNIWRRLEPNPSEMSDPSVDTARQLVDKPGAGAWQFTDWVRSHEAGGTRQAGQASDNGPELGGASVLNRVWLVYAAAGP